MMGRQGAAYRLRLASSKKGTSRTPYTKSAVSDAFTASMMEPSAVLFRWRIFCCFLRNREGDGREARPGGSSAPHKAASVDKQMAGKARRSAAATTKSCRVSSGRASPA